MFQYTLEAVLPKNFSLQVPKLFLCACSSRKSISLAHTEPIRCCKNSMKFEKKFVDKNYFCHCNSSAIYSVFVSKQCFKTLVILEKSIFTITYSAHSWSNWAVLWFWYFYNYSKLQKKTWMVFLDLHQVNWYKLCN